MVTIKDVLSAWWADYRPTIAETTAHRKEQIIRLHIVPYIGDIAVRCLQGKDLQYLGALSPNNHIGVRKVLNPAMSWAVAHKLCRRNILAGMPWPKYIPHEVETYKLSDLEALLVCLEGRWLWLPVYLASRTGLRRGEVCGLQWDDIDLERGYLTVRRSIVATSSHDVYIHPPKSRSSQRRVDLDPEAITVLRQRKTVAETHWVCEAPRRPGGMPNPWHITKMLHDACVSAGIPHHTFHALRHTHATMLLAEGVHPKIVAERLGHAKTSITLDTYSHMIPTMQAPAVAAVTHIFSCQGPT